jgi:rhamnosyltransferase
LIAAGIVLYNPNLERLKENIDAILNQVDSLIVVDNGSENVGGIEKLLMNYSKVLTINNSSNVGVAKALNQMCELANIENYEWILTLDQDSVCPENLIDLYKPCILSENIALICPQIQDINKGEICYHSDNGYEYINKCITSGALTNILIWKELGGFDELMFIDLVDFEFCKRVIDNNYKIVQVNAAVILHEIGKITNHRFLFWNIEVKNHSSFRKYYIAQNIIYYVKKHYKPTRILVAYLRLIKLLALVLLFETDKYNKLRMIIKGSVNGYRISKLYCKNK